MSNTHMAFLLTFLAGLSTLLGLIIIFIKLKNTDKIICASLSFAAGVMICVSITDLVPESITLLNNKYSGLNVITLSFLFIFIGIVTSSFIDRSLSTYENKKGNLFKVGIISMIAIIIHNIPEGIATFISTTKDISLGISLTIAIALHNIPEGISIGIPIYYSTNSKLKAFIYTLISAISEPIGAFITYIFLTPYINNNILGLLFSFIAGIMLQISFVELLPTSKKYQLPIITNISFCIGILFMLLHFVL